MTRVLLASLLGPLGLLGLSACGSGDGTTAEDPLAGFSEEVRAATESAAADFPEVGGRSLKRLTTELNAESEIGLATPTVAPGKSRLAFGVITPEGGVRLRSHRRVCGAAPGGDRRRAFPGPG